MTDLQLENHSVGVLSGVEACEKGCSELARLGLASEDVGLVLSDGMLAHAQQCVRNEAAEGRAHPVHSRLLAAEVVGRSEDGRVFHASSGYPADLIRSSRNRCGDGGSAFDGLFPEREGRALAAAISSAGAAIWVRTRTLDLTVCVAGLLLQISAERVRTFSRPASTD